MKNDVNQSHLILNTSSLVFLKASQTLNFTETAECFGITQGAVSRIVKNWEDEWGMTFFNRNRRPICLTNAGILLKQELERYIQSFNNLALSLRGDNFLKPLIRIGCVESMSVDLLPKLVIRLRSHYPQIITVIGTSNSLHRQLVEGTLDIIISSDSTAEVTNLRKVKIFQEGSLLVLPKSFQGTDKYLTWKSLQFSGIPFIKYHHATGGGKLNDVFVSTSGISLTSQLEVDSNSTMLSLIAEGIGWTISRASTILQNKGLSEKIFFTQMPSPLLVRKLYVLTRRNESERFMNDFVKTASSILRSEILDQLICIAPWMKNEIFVLDPDSGVLKNKENQVLVENSHA